MLALEFPPINELIRWQDICPDLQQGRSHRGPRHADRHRRVPRRRSARIRWWRRPVCATSPRRSVTFIENDIVMQTMGKDGLPWTPFLLSLFIFVYLCNLPGIIPLFQMPATARMAIPLFLALTVWVIYNTVGFKHNGIKYITSMVWPKSVPVAHAPARRRHRSALQHRPAPLLAGRPTFRQHARRSHVADHVRLLDQRVVLRRDEAAGPATRWRSCRSSCCSS